MTSGTTTMNEDWRYSEDRLQLREKVYKILLSRFGSQLDSNGEPLYSMQSITECCHDWVSQGHATSNGIVAYYQAYYS